MSDSELDVPVEASALDLPPIDGLEDVFVLPAYLQGDEQISRWHDEIVQRLRRESQGLPMKTIQTTLLERIATHYVRMRWMERQDDVSENQLRLAMQHWLTMTQEFNRLLEKNQDKILAKVISEVQTILNEVLPMISNREERMAVTRALMERFSALEL